jgi:hypothetical protein
MHQDVIANLRLHYGFHLFSLFRALVGTKVIYEHLLDWTII